MQQLFHPIRRDLIRRSMPPPPAALDLRSYLHLFQEDKPSPPLSPSSLSRSIYTLGDEFLDHYVLDYCTRYRNSAKLKRTTIKKGVHSYLLFYGYTRAQILRIFRTTPHTVQNEAVHSFLKTHHFSRAQISKIQLPPLSALQTAQPNIEFLRSKGLSGPQTAKVICSCPTLFTISLANQIVPAYDALKSFFKSDSNTAAVIRNCPGLLLENVDPLLARSSNFLYGCGVPQSVVVRLLTASPWIIAMTENNLKQVVERLRDEMGFDPSTHKFREALGIITRLTRFQWESQLRLFKKWGLSEDQVIAGFRRFPKLMSMPAEKINGVMELLVNSLGWEPSVIIVTYPTLLVYGLSERFTPRVGVLLSRVSNDLMKKEDITPHMFTSTDKCFLDKYVLHEAPGLLSLFPKGISIDRETDAGKGRARLTVHA